MIGKIIKDKLKKEIDPRTGENFDVKKDIELLLMLEPEQAVLVDGKKANSKALGEIKESLENVRSMTGFDKIHFLQVKLKKGSWFAEIIVAGERSGKKKKETLKL
jgi:hypothetical protein